MKRMVLAISLAVGLSPLSVCADDSQLWHMPLNQAGFTHAWSQQLKLLAEAEPNQTALDAAVAELAARFINEESLVSLSLLLESRSARKRIYADPQMCRELLVSLLEIGEMSKYEPDLHTLYGLMEQLIPRHRAFLFLDALGNPIPNAQVQLFRQKPGGIRQIVAESILDERGLMLLGRQQVGPAAKPSFVLRHRHYGAALIRAQAPRWPVIYVPLAPMESEARQGSAWGSILDENDNPVAGAEVVIYQVCAPGGGLLRGRNLLGWHACSISDADGRFYAHLPAGRNDAMEQELAPKSRYQVLVDVPKDPNFIRTETSLPAGRQSTIVLKRLTGPFRAFSFEDANGPITDPDILKKIEISIHPPDANIIHIRYRDFSKGAFLPLGTFKAFHDKLKFEPVEVTAESPSQLVFRQQRPEDEDVTFSGRVVYGFTDKPAQGAFVARAVSPMKQGSAVAMLTDTEWLELYKLETNAPLDTAAIEPLRRIWHVQQVIRTDDHGRFAVTLPRKEADCEFHVFQQGYMPVYHMTAYYAKDPNKRIELPTSRLFEAGQVGFELAFEPQPHAGIHIQWDMHCPQVWPGIDDFVAYRSMRNVGFPLRRRIQCGRHYKLYVPAHLCLQLSFQIHTPNDWWSPIYTEQIRLEPGQSIELGQIDIEPRMPVYVQVLDSSGKAVKGVAVRHGRVYQDHNHYFLGQRRITDTDGLAEFLVPPYSTARNTFIST